MSTCILWAFRDGEQGRGSFDPGGGSAGRARAPAVLGAVLSGARPCRSRAEPSRADAPRAAPPRPPPARGGGGGGGGGARGRGPGGAGRTARHGAARHGSVRLHSPAMASKCPKCDKTVYFGERIPGARPRIPLPEPGAHPRDPPRSVPGSPSRSRRSSLLPPFPKPRCISGSFPPSRSRGVSPVPPSPSPAHPRLLPTLDRGSPVGRTQRPARQQLLLPRGPPSQRPRPLCSAPAAPPRAPIPGLCWGMLLAGWRGGGGVGAPSPAAWGEEVKQGERSLRWGVCPQPVLVLGGGGSRSRVAAGLGHRGTQAV